MKCKFPGCVLACSNRYDTLLKYSVLKTEGSGSIRGNRKVVVMLVLSRKADEQIMIGDGIVITVVEIKGDKVRLGIDAPRDVTVHRKEVVDAIRKEAESQTQAANSQDPPK